MDELQALGKQDPCNQSAETGGTLTTFGTEVCGFERGQIGHHARVTNLLAHGVKDGGQANDQQVAQAGSDLRCPEGLDVVAALAETNGFVERNAQHQVGVFEFASVGLKKVGLGFRQESPPILLNRVIPAGRAAGIHRHSLPKSNYTRKYV